MSCCCFAFEGGNYNLWLRDIKCDIFLLICLSGPRTTQVKTSWISSMNWPCLLRVDYAVIKRNDHANKTIAYLVWKLYTPAAYSLPGAIPFCPGAGLGASVLSSPYLSTLQSLASVRYPTRVRVCTSARWTAVSYRCSQKLDLRDWARAKWYYVEYKLS